MAVQFQSYGGGPHGASPVMLPGVAPSFMGELGSMLNQLGQIPAEMQAATLKKQLNDLLLKSLTTPQTVQQTTQSPDVMVPNQDLKEYEPPTVGSVNDNYLAGMMPPTPESMGDLFYRQPGESVTKTVTNPAFQDITDRMQAVGPAFGWKFPTPIEQIYATYLAKSAGLGDLEKLKQEGREKIQGMKGEQQQGNISSTYDRKEKLEEIRQPNRLELQANDLESKEKIARERNATLSQIENNKELSADDRLKQTLKARGEWKKEDQKNYADRTKAMLKQANNLDEVRIYQQINGFNDNLLQLESQINKIRQLEPTDKNNQQQLQNAVSRYNDTVDNIKRLDPSASVQKYSADDFEPTWANFFRTLPGAQSLPGVGAPTRALKQTPAGQPSALPNAKPAAPSSNVPPATSGTLPNNTYTPSTVSPEELKRRRDNIFRKSQPQ